MAYGDGNIDLPDPLYYRVPNRIFAMFKWAPPVLTKQDLLHILSIIGDRSTYVAIKVPPF
jgi:hypothetical protein